MNGYVTTTITNSVDDTTAINVAVGQRLLSIKGRSVQSPTWGFIATVSTYTTDVTPLQKHSIAKYGIRNGKSVNLSGVLPYIPSTASTPSAMGHIQVQIIATNGCDAEVTLTNGTVFA